MRDPIQKLKYKEIQSKIIMNLSFLNDLIIKIRFCACRFLWSMLCVVLHPLHDETESSDVIVEISQMRYVEFD